MTFKSLAMAAALAAGLAIPASAMPAAPKAGIAETQLVQPAQYRGKRWNKAPRAFNRGYKHRGYKGYKHRRNYYGGPRGWKRYSYRPSRWRSRGCIIVGPIWFCP